MRQKYRIYLVILSMFLTVLLSHRLTEEIQIRQLTTDFVEKDTFRAQELSEEFVEKLRKVDGKTKAELTGLYLLQKEIENNPFRENKNWKIYQSYCEAIWKDVKYFPIPQSIQNPNYKVSYTDSWMSERTYGGTRGHEGTDLIASEGKPGLYPVLSMTDGVIENLGWLEKGGWRVGVRSTSGGYFYYAHLDSYAGLKEGQYIEAGKILGFMGDSGYGKEGTTGMFATHLHLGIYILYKGKEISINPYWILKTFEEKSLFCSF